MQKRESELEIHSDERYESELARYDTPGQTAVLKFNHPAIGDPANPLNQQRMFLECIRDGKPPAFTAENGLAGPGRGHGSVRIRGGRESREGALMATIGGADILFCQDGGPQADKHVCPTACSGTKAVY